MRINSQERFIPTNVLIAFEDGSVAFRVPRGATVADITENLDRIGIWHQGPPISIYVRFKSSEDKSYGEKSPIL